MFELDDDDDFTPAAIDVTHRFLMECLRMYPIVPMAMRDVPLPSMKPSRKLKFRIAAQKRELPV